MPHRWTPGVIALFCILSVSPLSRAQSVEIGLRGGVSISTLHDDEFALTHTPVGQSGENSYTFGYVNQRVGGHLAAAATVPLTSWLALQSELQYAQKGATIIMGRYENCGGPLIYCIPSLLEQTSLYRLSYLQLPVLLKARIPAVGSFAVSLLAGPSVGLNLGAELATETFDVSGLPDIAKPETHPQVGIVGGVELSYRVERAGRLLLDVRLHPILTDIPLDRTDASVRNPAFEATLGWALPWGDGE